MFDEETRKEIGALATALKIEPAALMAVAQVESGGVAVGWNNLPLIRWEGHYFYRLLKGQPAKRAKAVAAHLASVHAGGVPNPKAQEARYALLAQAEAIDKEAALSSCSWGIGQVMGANFKDLGFDSAAELADRCKESVAGQVDVMARFIRVNGLVDELQKHRWRDFALAYNGPWALAAGYDKLIEKAFNAFSKG